MSIYILHNQDLLRKEEFTLKIDNRSFLYSDGFFETIKVINFKCFNFSYHYKRIEKSCNLFKFNFNISESVLNTLLEKLAKKNNIVGGRIRVVFFRDSGGKYLPLNNSSSFVAEIESGENYFSFNKNGLEIGLYTEIKKGINSFSNCKSTSATISVFSSIYAKENNWDDCLIINSNNNIIQSSNSNLFIVSDNIIITPSKLDACVNGTMRSFIVQNFKVQERSITEQELLEADELFLTNAIQGVRWVEKLMEKKYQSHNIARLVFDKLNLETYLQS